MSEGSTRPIVRFASLIAALLAVASGCLGGQTGTEQIHDPEQPPPSPEPGRPTGEGSNDGCDDIEEVVSADDDSLGFSANDVLSFVLGETASDLRWMPPPSNLSFGPETGVVAVELGVSLLGDVRKVHSIPKPSTGGEGPAIGIQCPPERLEVSVELEISTAGGALAERIPAELSVRDSSFAELRASIDLGSIAGSFSVTPAHGARTDKLEISALFSPSGHAGLLTGNLDTEDPQGAASRARFVYARWPADETCSAHTPVVSVPLTDPGAAGLRSALERLREVKATPIDWRAADTATLTLEIEHAEVACLRPADFGGPLGLELPVTVHAQTSDGRVKSSLPGTLSGADGTSKTKLMAVRTCEGTSAALQAEACGISEVELGDFSNLMLSLNATVSDRVSGELMIVGVRPTSCVPTPNSSCPSNPAEPLETGEF